MLVSSLPPLPAGGAEKQALLLAKKMIEKGLEVTFISPGQNKAKDITSIEGITIIRPYSIFSRLFEFFAGFKKKHFKKNVRIDYTDNPDAHNEINNPVGWPTVVYYSLFYLHCLLYLWPRRKKFDIVHSHTMEWPAIVAAKLGKRLKKKVVIKDSTMNGFKSLRRYPSGQRLQQTIIEHSFFVAMTGVIENNLKLEGVPDSKIFRIPNGIEIKEQSRNNVQNDNINVLFVGNLYQQPAKGVDILLKAWKKVVEKIPSARLQIIGDGDIGAYEEYVRQLQISNSTKFFGKQINLENYYEQASLFVLPSRREGMSNALLEAMMHELPCIATDISGNQDLIQNGVNGILVPPSDIYKLAESICEMLNNREEAVKMGKKAKEEIKQKVDIQIITEKYISLYTKIIDQATH